MRYDGKGEPPEFPDPDALTDAERREMDAGYAEEVALAAAREPESTRCEACGRDCRLLIDRASPCPACMTDTGGRDPEFDAALDVKFELMHRADPAKWPKFGCAHCAAGGAS